jgi:hypothetical protein
VIPRPAMVLLLLGLSVAGVAAWSSTSLAVSSLAAAGAAALLVLAALLALTSEMPPLPALVLSDTAEIQGRMARARAGDRMARTQVLEILDSVEPWESRRRAVPFAQREDLLALPPAGFDAFLSQFLEEHEKVTA